MSWNPLRARRERELRRIAAVMLALPEDEHYAFPLSLRAGIAPGAIYPALARMHRDGWLVDGWEANVEGRRRRRWYRLTELGKRELTQLLRKAGES